MPIKEENKLRYPRNWTAIRKRILKRADNRCEGSDKYPGCRASNGEPHPETGSKVVLTVAHLDHQPENNEDENLRAWCQRCHLTYDAAHHSENASRTSETRRHIEDIQRYSAHCLEHWNKTAARTFMVDSMRACCAAFLEHTSD